MDLTDLDYRNGGLKFGSGDTYVGVLMYHSVWSEASR